MDTVFFVTSKLAGALLRADTWILIALAVILLALSRGWRRTAMTVSSVTFVLLVILSALPLGGLLLQPIERTYPPNPPLTRVDGIIVLGGAEDIRASAFWGQTQFNEAGERLTAALALARAFPQARVLFTCGSGALRDLGSARMSEAASAESFFRDQGLDPARLLLEGSSRNTAENARRGLDLARPRAGETWLLVTSAFHMPRAMRSFAAAGWPRLVAYPVDYRTSAFADGTGWDLTRNIQVLNIAMRERVGQIAYALTGR
jgi:uncharacterized SAM-binding protein YcdF (DUF218 family)